MKENNRQNEDREVFTNEIHLFVDSVRRVVLR